MDKITLLFPYYNNPSMFIRQQEVWHSYPKELRDRFEVIVVDDGSSDHPAIDSVLGNINYQFRLYRINVDIPWNQVAARNLAAYESDDGWLFMTDIDHVLDACNFNKLFSFYSKANMRSHYTFARANAPGMGQYHYHPNSFFMHRSLYIEVGGYDEEFSGKVYSSDGLYKTRLHAISQAKALPHIQLIRYGREVIPDASTVGLLRGQDDVIMRKVRMRNRNKILNGEKPIVLSFPWSRLI